MTRRRFLRNTSAAVLAAPTIIPASALGKDGRPAPSERISLGIIGAGGMGKANLHNCARYNDVVVLGVCDVWQQRRASVLEKYKSTAAGYSDYRELLIWLCSLFLGCFAFTGVAADLKFQTHRIGNSRSEACGVGDFNKDGNLDIIAGAYLYLAPDWKPQKVRTLGGSVDEKGDGYMYDFMNVPFDVDRRLPLATSRRAGQTGRHRGGLYLPLRRRARIGREMSRSDPRS